MRNQEITSGQGSKRSLDDFIVALILSKEFILDFLGLGLFANLAICCLIVVRIVYVQWKIPLFVYAAVSFFPLLTVQAMLMGGSLDVAIGNLARLFQVGLYALFFLFLRVQKPDHLQTLFEKGFVPFNAILVLNMAVIVFQYVFPGSLVAASSSYEAMGVDAMSGLFGAASTHSIALYTTFVVVYDISVMQKGLYDKRTLVSYIAALSLSSLYIATLNDNKALFFFLPLGVLLCWAIYIAFNYRTAAVKTSLLIPLIACMLLLLYLGVPAVQNFVQDYIARSINMAVNAWDLGSYVNGSDERFQMVAYALSLPAAWGFGDGLGMADVYQEGYRGFNHFGQSDFGSIVILGGFWLYFLVLYFYVRVFSISSSSTQRKKPVLVIAMLILLVYSSVYTQVFTQVRISIPVILLSYALFVYWQGFNECLSANRASDADPIIVKIGRTSKRNGEFN